MYLRNDGGETEDVENVGSGVGVGGSGGGSGCCGPNAGGVATDVLVSSVRPARKATAIKINIV